MADFDLTPPGDGFSSTESRWNWTRSQLPGFFRRGYSGNQTLISLRESGLGVGTQRFYNWWRDMLGIWREGSRIGNTSPDNIPSDDLFGDAPSWQSKRYGWHYEIEGYDPDTGKTFISNYTIETSTKGTIGDIANLIEDDISTRYPGLRDKMTSGKITTGWLLEN